MSKAHIWIVIPCYNDGRSAREQTSKLTKAGYKNIVVIDDCSRDNSYELLEKEPVHLLRHVVNRGQGAALKTSINYVLNIDKAKDVIIVTFDADGQHLVDEIPLLVEPLQARKSKYDIIIGSRFLSQKSIDEVPTMKRIVLKLGALFIYMLYGTKVSDSQNGFRALSRKAAEKIEIRQDRMEHASEILAQITKQKLRYKEVPVFIPYENKRSQSWTNAFGMGLRLLYSKFFK